MRKLIFITILIALFSFLSIAQETTVWLNGSKNDSAIIKKKADIEAMGLKVFINDSAEREKRHSIKTVASGDEKFDRIFREARELMDKEEWKQAAEKFNQIACDCPENKQVDAALYWLAYCYIKQKMPKEADATVNRLLKNFPNSSWADDARVLKFQIARYGGTSGTATTNGQGSSQSVYYTPGFEAFQPAQSGNIVSAINLAQNSQLDREDEIKLAAFRSLLAADPKRGIEAMANILRSDSKASETFKREVLRTLRSSRYYGNHVFDNSPASENSSMDLVKQLNPLLRDTLVKVYPAESSILVRTEIIYAIAYINDEASVNYLGQLYPTESNRELKKTVINSFTLVPYSWGVPAVAQRVGSTAAVSPQKTPASTPATNPVRELRFGKLMEIFRGEKDLELKRLAFSNLQRFSGWSNRDGMVDMLSQLYDSETNDAFKLSIINSFSSLTKNTQAVNKLMDIAKTDKSNDMRLQAIRALGNNNSPEVIRFLEDLLK